MNDEELTGCFDGIEQRLEAFIREEGAATRSHFDIVAEAMKADVRVIAEGHKALQDDVDALQDGQQRLEGRQGRLEVRQQALEARQGKLEKGFRRP